MQLYYKNHQDGHY